jgi:uncharacterized protein YpmS
MSSTWRALVIVSLAINAVLVLCVAVLLTRDTASPSVVVDAERKADVAQKTAVQALNLAVEAKNTADPLQASTDQIVDIVAEQTTLRQQMNALCDWAASTSAPAGGTDDAALSAALKGLQDDVCVAPLTP